MTEVEVKNGAQDEQEDLVTPWDVEGMHINVIFSENSTKYLYRCK